MSDLAFERDVRRPRPAPSAWLQGAIVATVLAATGGAILAAAPDGPEPSGAAQGRLEEPATGRPGRRY